MKITYSTTTKLRLLSQFQNVNESLKVFADYHNVGAGSLKRWIQQYLTIRDLKAKLREREVQIAFSKKLIEISNREVKRSNDIKRFKK
ncbi:hypothetical protein CP1MG86_MNBNLCLN_02646 [Companilactobacillus paralimentarius]